LGAFSPGAQDYEAFENALEDGRLNEFLRI